MHPLRRRSGSESCLSLLPRPPNFNRRYTKVGLEECDIALRTQLPGSFGETERQTDRFLDAVEVKFTFERNFPAVVCFLSHR